MLGKIIPVLLIGIVVHYVVFYRPYTPKDLLVTMSKIKQLKESGPILNENGTLKEVGWSFKNNKEMNIENAAGAFMGIKALNRYRWKKYDYYAIIGDKEAFQVYICDIGFKIAVFFKYFDFSTQTGKKTATMITSVGSGPYADHPDTHTLNKDYFSSYDHNGHSYKTKDSSQKRVIDFSSPLADFQLTFNTGQFKAQDGDAMIDVLPLSNENKTWFYNEKYYNIPFQAKVKFAGDKAFRTVETSKMSGVIDIGRGFWNYHNDFFWMSGGQVKGKTRLGWTLQQGMSSADSRKSQPDYFFVGYEGTQMLPVKFKVDVLNFKNTIKVYTADDVMRGQRAPGTMELVMQPMGDMQEVADFYKVSLVDIHHVYGMATGWFIDKNGVEHVIDAGNTIFESFYAKV